MEFNQKLRLKANYNNIRHLTKKNWDSTNQENKHADFAEAKCGAWVVFQPKVG